MQPHPLEEDSDARRAGLFWAVLAALVMGQLAAFWMLCSHQVRKAEIRGLGLQVQRVAAADCLQYIPRATLNSCANRVDPGRGGDAAIPARGQPAAVPHAAATTMSSIVPVSAAYR